MTHAALHLHLLSKQQQQQADASMPACAQQPCRCKRRQRADAVGRRSDRTNDSSEATPQNCEIVHCRSRVFINALTAVAASFTACIASVAVSATAIKFESSD